MPELFFMISMIVFIRGYGVGGGVDSLPEVGFAPGCATLGGAL